MTQPGKQRPYLLRAMHEWMIDNGFTPHIVADATVEGFQSPGGQAEDGKIVFNVSHAATKDLLLGNELISFEARFNGVPRQISIPIDAVLGIYARESGQGMIFSDENPPPASPDDDHGNADSRRAKLTVVK